MANDPRPREGTWLPDLDPGSDHGGDFIDVEVIYAEPQSHQLVSLKLPTGSTVWQAVEASGIIRKFPEIDFAKCKLGIFGKITDPDVVVSTQDRIEIYRPLLADPKENRLQRAAPGARSGKKRKR